MGDCKPINLFRELEKVVQKKDTPTLEANNRTLAAQVVDLNVEIALKDEELQQLQAQLKEGMDRIWDFIGNPSDVANKAQLFNNKIKTNR